MAERGGGKEANVRIKFVKDEAAAEERTRPLVVGGVIVEKEKGEEGEGEEGVVRRRLERTEGICLSVGEAAEREGVVTALVLLLLLLILLLVLLLPLLLLFVLAPPLLSLPLTPLFFSSLL